MQESIEVKATAFKNGDVEVTTEMVINEGKQDEVREVLMQRVIQTQDEKVREGLISIGWTPPDEAKPIVADVPMLVDAIIGKGFKDDKHHKSMMVYGHANKDGWDRPSLLTKKPQMLLALYTAQA
jgi:hypothetical protein